MLLAAYNLVRSDHVSQLLNFRVLVPIKCRCCCAQVDDTEFNLLAVESDETAVTHNCYYIVPLELVAAKALMLEFSRPCLADSNAHQDQTEELFGLSECDAALVIQNLLNVWNQHVLDTKILNLNYIFNVVYFYIMLMLLICREFFHRALDLSVHY